MKKLLLLIFSLCIFTLSNVYSKPVTLFLDYAVFALDDSSSLFELYYSFLDTSLSYKKNAEHNTYDGNVVLRVQIRNNFQHTAEIDYQWNVQQVHSKSKIDTVGTFIGQKNFQLGFGDYTVTVSAYDEFDSTIVKVYTFNVNIPKFTTNFPKLSDIELATDIIQVVEKSSNNESEFYKSGSYVIPNPTLEIISTNPVLKFYAEVYNSNTIENEKYILNYKIENSLNKEVVSIPTERVPTNGTIMLNDELPLQVLPSGIYYFYVQVIFPRNDTTMMVEKRKKFYLINPSMPPNESEEFLTSEELFLRSEFSSMTETETNLEMEKLAILLPKNQLDIAKSLTETKAKQKFLFQYWDKLDTDPLTVVNEAYVEFKDNVQFANKFYKHPMIKDGWRSDRGRVRLKYGKPTQIDLRVAGSDSRPHEIWFYQGMQGGVIFVFVEIGGVNRYVQVHSNHFNELHEENWYERFARLSK
jgi:GWxTD domain-containing protein